MELALILLSIVLAAVAITLVANQEAGVRKAILGSLLVFSFFTFLVWCIGEKPDIKHYGCHDYNQESVNKVYNVDGNYYKNPKGPDKTPDYDGCQLVVEINWETLEPKIGYHK